MLEALYNEPLLDALWRITDWAYSQPTDLLLRGATGITELLSSESGTRQGDVFFAQCDKTVDGARIV